MSYSLLFSPLSPFFSISNIDTLARSLIGLNSNHPEIPSELKNSVLLHSKTFDPKLFLSTVHPTATFQDLNFGREKLKENLEQRSGALKLLVEAEWDRFVGVKATTESEFQFFFFFFSLS